MSSSFSCGNSRQYMPFGRAKEEVGIDDFVRRHDGAKRNIVLGHRDFFVDNLQRMNGRDDRRVGSDFSFFREQRELEVRIAAALADPGALAIYRHRTADNQVDLFHLVQALPAGRIAPRL